MNNRLTFQWGVVPGREVGQVTKRFHKTRKGTDAERAIARSHSVTLKEARRLLKYAQDSNARKDTTKKTADCIKLEVARQRKIQAATIKAQSADTNRLARVAAYTETTGV